MFYDPVLPFSSFFWRRGAGRSKKHNIKASCNFHFSDFSEHPWPLPTCKSCGTRPFNVLEEKVPSSKIMSTWAPTPNHTCGAVEKQGAEDPRIETWWNMHASTKTLTKRFDSNPHFVDPLAVPSQQSIVHSRWMKKRRGKWRDDDKDEVDHGGEDVDDASNPNQASGNQYKEKKETRGQQKQGRRVRKAHIVVQGFPGDWWWSAHTVYFKLSTKVRSLIILAPWKSKHCIGCIHTVSSLCFPPSPGRHGPFDMFPYDGSSEVNARWHCTFLFL